MFEKKDKRYIYNLMDDYLDNKIDEVAFCDEIYFSYCLEIDSSKLNKTELETFSELATITNRFSPYEEDHKLDPKAFATKEEVHSAVIKTKQKLQAFLPPNT